MRHLANDDVCQGRDNFLRKIPLPTLYVSEIMAPFGNFSSLQGNSQFIVAIRSNSLRSISVEMDALIGYSEFGWLHVPSDLFDTRSAFVIMIFSPCSCSTFPSSLIASVVRDL